ncbi:unnamed protein product [Clonostachys byssicola]|uniref:Transcription factor domain-containing protein n=1 Tax=Clonostachys byssicola TaxID=160290 RepID=A0A9N9U7W1_9HYPO|nr:unnamed protein product [Clonostachys byssicola]
MASHISCLRYGAGLHRLDTAKAREERQRNGCNEIELEVQRRIWWHMVADDWLMSFAGGPFDGVYSFHSQHMKVDYPKNVDDHHITASMPVPDLPLSTPTAMSTFLARVRFATLCREIVDIMGPTLLEGNEPEYSVVLEIGQRLQNHLDELPPFLRLDPDSIRMNQDVCAQRPDLALQRLATNFSIHARICRLHRLYHLEGSLNPEYAYSRTMCIRSAHRVLELRRAMDQVGTEAGCHPARFWKITQHVFLAALTLATDVSINPEGPDADDRKAKVMAAYKTLESSKEDSITLVETIQKNLQALMTTLESRRTAIPSSLGRAQRPRRPETVIAQVALAQHPPRLEPIGPEVSDEPGLGSMNQDIPISVDGSVSAMDSGSSGVDQLWDDFWAVAPDLEATDWNMLLEDMYTDWEPNIQ